MPENKRHAEKHSKNFASLGSVLLNFLSGNLSTEDKNHSLLSTAIVNSCKENGYFTNDSIRYALKAIGEMLAQPKLATWANIYKLNRQFANSPKTIGVVMAGNIPLVGFHDFLCVLITGNHFLGKLSQQDRHLLPAIAEILIEIDRGYKHCIQFTQDKIQGFDAVIATGSNNTARYFEYYFGKYPHIIRKNRNSIAVLSGNETHDELNSLAEDMFLYFGLGCRNVSKLFVPEGYDFNRLANASASFSHYIDHNHFRNNYDYYKTIFQMNNLAFIDCGFFILQENPSLHNPVSVIHYENYSDEEQIRRFMDENHENLQCIIGNSFEVDGILPFGNAQKPQLSDFADNIDTLNFLLELQ